MISSWKSVIRDNKTRMATIQLQAITCFKPTMWLPTYLSKNKDLTYVNIKCELKNLFRHVTDTNTIDRIQIWTYTRCVVFCPASLRFGNRLFVTKTDVMRTAKKNVWNWSWSSLLSSRTVTVDVRCVKEYCKPSRSGFVYAGWRLEYVKFRGGGVKNGGPGKQPRTFAYLFFSLFS